VKRGSNAGINNSRPAGRKTRYHAFQKKKVVVQSENHSFYTSRHEIARRERKKA